MKQVGVVLLFALLAAPAWGVGFTSRPCGLDMNRDGTIGQAENNDCNVCDGYISAGVVVARTTDPDSDGNAEDLIYLDSGTDGSDEAGCGAAGNPPCKTLNYAINTIANGTGEEDIICVRGTHVITSQIVMDEQGKATSYTADLYPNDWQRWGATGDQSYSYPEDPFMIVGWDYDNDGEYPPYDTDDTAVLSGDQGGGTYSGFKLFDYGAQYVEIAHLTIDSFGRGRTDATSGGILSYASGAQYSYIHDNVFDYINGDSSQDTTRIAFSTFQGDGDYLAVINNNFTNAGSFLNRGSCGGCDDFRFDWNSASFTVTSDTSPSVGTQGVTFYRNWDEMTRVSVSWNYADANPGQYTPTGQAVTVGISSSICVQDLWAYGNELIDFRTNMYVRLSTTGGECQSRPNTSSFVGNKATNTYSGYSNARCLVVENGTAHAEMYQEYLLFANNWCQQTPGASEWSDGILIWGGNSVTDMTGTAYVFNNTIEGDYSGSFMNLANGLTTYNIDMVVKYNIMTGEVDDTNIRWGASDATLTSDYNVFDADSNYKHTGTTYTSLALAQAGKFDEANSSECDPTFVSSSDLHLQSGDSCAQDLGSTIDGDGALSYIDDDLDLDARPQTYWDAGMDEYESGYVPVGACCDSTCAITTDAGCTDWQGAGTTCTPDPCIPPAVPEEGEWIGISLEGVEKQ